MSLIRWTPYYEPLLEIEKAFGDTALLSGFTPAIDLYEKDGNLIVEVALAGYNPSNVSINVDQNILTIEASLEQKREIDDKNYYRREMRAGSFHRAISLPAAVSSDRTTAEYKNGILTVIMPKREEAKPTPISVKIIEA